MCLHNIFHRYLLTRECNLCAKDGQSLLGIKKRLKRILCKWNHFQILMGTERFHHFNFSVQNKFYLKKTNQQLWFMPYQNDAFVSWSYSLRELYFSGYVGTSEFVGV